MKNPYDVFPAVIGWKDSENTFNGIVLGPDEDKQRKESKHALRTLLKTHDKDWKGVRLIVIPLPEMNYDEILLSIHDIILDIEEDNIQRDSFYVLAGDLFS